MKVDNLSICRDQTSLAGVTKSLVRFNFSRLTSTEVNSRVEPSITIIIFFSWVAISLLPRSIADLAIIEKFHDLFFLR